MGLPEFQSDLIQSIYTHIYQRVGDNFDFVRFGSDGVDRSNQINVLQHAQNLVFVLNNLESFHTSSLLLSDAASRSLYLQLLKYRFLGHPHIRINPDMTWTSIKAMNDRAASYAVGTSALKLSGIFGELRHHENIPVENGTVAIDAWSLNVAYGLGSGNHRQYYFERDGVSVRPDYGDYLIDGGACYGDTAIFFASSVGAGGKVFAFEPLPAHLDVIKFNVDQNALADRIAIIPAGIGEVSNHLNAIDAKLGDVASPDFSLLGRERLVPTMSVDDFVEGQGIKRIDFIKMDIEGFELRALKGAARSIEKHRPKLAISLYHKPEDFFEIPVYLKNVFPFYRLYLDHYSIFGEETVLYAIA